MRSEVACGLGGAAGVRVVWLAVVIAGLAVTIPGRVVHAQAGEAESQIRQGLELRRQGLDARALPFFENAYRLSRNARTAAQLGMAEMALGYWVEADRHLTEALTVADHPWVSKNKDTLDEARAKVRAMIGQLTITGPAGAEVLVNGLAVGRLPLAGPIPLGKGVIEVELRSPGYASTSKSVTLPGGGAASVSLLLLPTETKRAVDRPVVAAATTHASADAGSRPATTTTTAMAQPNVIVSRPDPGARPETPSSGVRPLSWAMGGVGLAGVAFGVFETVLMVGKQNDFNGHTVASPTPENPNRRVADCTTSALTDECSRLRDAYTQARTLAIVGYAAGGALVATSAVLLALSSRDHASGTKVGWARSRSIMCLPSVGAAGASCVLRF